MVMLALALVAGGVVVVVLFGNKLLMALFDW